MLGRGVVGAVVDGAIRDASALSDQGLAVFARGSTPAGPFKNGPGMIGVPVAIGGVVVSPGDVVVADDDGVAIVPRASAEWAAEHVQEVIAAEAVLRERIVAAQAGVPTAGRELGPADTSTELGAGHGY